MRRAIRAFAISFVGLALLTFSIVVVSDFDCQTPADDARCPYCHLTHQGPAEPQITKVQSVELVALLVLRIDSIEVAVHVSSEISPRAPPA